MVMVMMQLLNEFVPINGGIDARQHPWLKEESYKKEISADGFNR
jgi:hypothetical protein